MPTKPKTIPFGSAPLISPSTKKTLPFGAAPIATPVPKEKSLGTKLLDRATTGISDTVDALGPSSSFSLFGGARPLVRAAGTVGGMVGDVAGAAIGAGVDALGKVLPEGVKKVAGEVAAPVEDFIAPTVALGQKLFTGLKKASPETAKDISYAANALNVLPAGAGAKLAGKEAADLTFPKLAEHYLAVNAKDIARPTTITGPRFKAAAAIFNDAKARGIDIPSEMNKLGIRHDDLHDAGHYATLDTADVVKQGAYDAAEKVIRPAIKEVQYKVQNIPVRDIKDSIEKRIENLRMDPEDKQWMLDRTAERYGAGSGALQEHPHGYNLTALHDARITSSQRGKYKIDGSALENRPADLARIEENVFKTTFDRVAPPELKPARKELEKKFKVANYLEALNTKKVPESITKKAINIFGRGIGGAVGAKIAGFPGFLVGSRGGDMLFHAFEVLPGPLKGAVLRDAQANLAEPEAFQILRKKLGDAETERLMRRALPPAGGSSYKEPVPTLYTTPGGKTTPNKSEAIDLTAVEQGKAKPPKTDRRLSSYLKKVNAAQGGDTYTPPDQLPVIKMGKKPKPKKNLSDIFIK